MAQKSGNRFFAEAMLYSIVDDHVFRIRTVPSECGVI
jgi:hypothetical protein